MRACVLVAPVPVEAPRSRVVMTQHHCRTCGNVFCRTCCGSAAEVGGVPMRVCDACAARARDGAGGGNDEGGDGGGGGTGVVEYDAAAAESASLDDVAAQYAFVDANLPVPL